MNLDRNEDRTYDTLNPTDELTRFNAFLRNVISRYEGNERELTEFDRKTNDLLHYIELKEHLSASQGFKIYKKLREVRNERRKVKKENELLQPIYDYVNSNKRVQSDFAQILGKCRSIKNHVEERNYVTRTDVLEGMRF